jgi:hypothetical protein
LLKYGAYAFLDEDSEIEGDDDGILKKKCNNGKGV